MIGILRGNPGKVGFNASEDLARPALAKLPFKPFAWIAHKFYQNFIGFARRFAQTERAGVQASLNPNFSGDHVMSKNQIVILAVLALLVVAALVSLLVLALPTLRYAGLEDTQRALAPAMTLNQAANNFAATVTAAQLTATTDAMTATEAHYPTLTAIFATLTAYAQLKPTGTPYG